MNLASKAEGDVHPACASWVPALHSCLCASVPPNQLLALTHQRLQNTPTMILEGWNLHFLLPAHAVAHELTLATLDEVLHHRRLLQNALDQAHGKATVQKPVPAALELCSPTSKLAPA